MTMYAIAKRQSTEGMTLIETMVVIGIMGILFVLVSQIFLINQNLVALALGRADNDNGAIFAIRRMGELTRGATAVMASQTINSISYTSSSTVLVLKLPSIDSSNNIIASTYDYIAVYRDATDTTKIFTDTQKSGSSVRVNGKKLLTAYNSTMSFSYNNSTIASATRVSVFLINTQTIRNKALTTKAWTSIFLRNF